MSNIKFTGTIIKDPEIRFTPEGKEVLTFSIPLYTGGNKQNGYKPSVYVRVTAWEELAEQWQTLTKGTKVTVTGTPQPSRTYEQDGETKSAGLEVTANEIVIGNTFEETN